MDLNEKLAQLRRSKGFSQEQLADLLDVSRQSVSKWEAGASQPELEKLVALADLFGVSLDALVRPERSVEPCATGSVPANGAQEEVLARLDSLDATVQRQLRHIPCYEYKSRAQLFGLPLVHIHFSSYGRPCLAKGIIAVGNAAVGVVAVGGLSLGLLSFGGLAAGLLLAFGGVALGGVAFGGAAIGIFAIGGGAVGCYALGGAAVGSRFAAGGAASAPVALGDAVRGAHTLRTTQASAGQVRQFLAAQDLPGWLKALSFWLN